MKARDFLEGEGKRANRFLNPNERLRVRKREKTRKEFAEKEHRKGYSTEFEQRSLEYQKYRRISRAGENRKRAQEKNKREGKKEKREREGGEKHN